MPELDNNGALNTDEELETAPPAEEEEPIELPEPDDGDDTVDTPAPAAKETTVPIAALQDERRKRQELEQLLLDPARLREHLGIPKEQAAPETPALPEDWEYWTPNEQTLYLDNQELKKQVQGVVSNTQNAQFEQAKTRYMNSLDAIEARDRIALTAEEKSGSLNLAIAMANADPRLTEAQIAEEVYSMLAYKKLKAARSARSTTVQAAKTGLASTQAGRSAGAVNKQAKEYATVDEAINAACDAAQASGIIR